MKRSTYKENPVLAVMARATRQNIGLSLGIAVTVLGAVVAALLPPLVLARIVDALALGAAAPLRVAVLYFALLALSGLLESGREVLLTLFGQKITHALRTALSEKLARLSADTLTRQEPGEVTARFVGDVDTVETLFTSGIISMFADVCKIVSIFAIIGMENRGLALVLLALLPGIFAFTRAVQRRMLAAQLDNRAAVSRVTNHVPETLRCIRTIHTLGAESFMEKRYDTGIGQGYAAMEKTNFFDAMYSPVILILNAAVSALVLLLSASGNTAVLALFGMSVGTAVAVINYIAQVFSPIQSLGMEIQTIQSAVAGVRRIRTFLEQPERGTPAEREENENGTGEPCAAGATPCIELRGVDFGYNGQPVLAQLSFSVLHGEQVTLSGRTGAGKSTVFKLLLGLYRPQGGAVLVEGRPAHAIPDSEKRRLFGYVEQAFHLVPGTVKEQITLFDPAITDAQAHAAAALAGLEDTIRALPQGFDTPCAPALFSQGQWQLLGIARAVAAGPKILLLDEITANLDAETEQAVLHALSRAAQNRTVLSISHRMYQKTGGRVVAL